uniref:Multifunctional protein n=1 Tax=Solanum tuberosum TaxID=4113 RepID=M0ZX91_SOLTU
MAINSQLVSTEIGKDGIAIIRIRNPPVNALALSVIDGLKEQYEEAVERNDVKAIVLTGDDKFCGGLDINIIQKVQKNGDTSFLPDASVELVIDTIENGKKPSVAAIQGFALGGGLELAMGCSARIATSRAELGLPELKLGLIPGCGGTQRLPRLVGTSKAIEMLMSSKIITSEEGKELGIIDDVVASHEDLLTFSRLWALDIAEGRIARTHTLRRTDKIEPIHKSSAILEVKRQQEDKVFRELVLSKSAKALLHAYFAERATSKVPGITDCKLKHRKIEKVAVIGGGLMGSGIATALILSSIQVILKEINFDYLQKSVKSIEVNLHSLVKRGDLLEEKMKKAFSLLKGVVDYEEFTDVDMVMEVVNEEVLLKQSIFEEIENICHPHCIFASNTSTIDLNVIGARTKSQDRIVGTHLFSPAHVMPLLEIVQTENTSKQVILDVLKFAKIIQKVPIVVKNCTGFAVNRTFFPYMQGAEILANLGIDVYRIDRVITEFGMRIGPFQLFDLSGYSIFLAVVKEFAAAFPDRTFQCPLVQLMMANGKKNGRGYYLYKKGKIPEPDLSVLQIVEESRRLASIMPGGEPISVMDQEIVEMLFFPVVNEACRVIEERVVVRASDLDVASVHGMKFPSERGGIMYWADSIGAEYIYARLKYWSKAYGSFFKPSQFLQERATKGIPLAEL